jgi:hypothetical protein
MRLVSKIQFHVSIEYVLSPKEWYSRPSFYQIRQPLMSSGLLEEQPRANHRRAIGKEQVPQLYLLQVRILAYFQKNGTPHHWKLCAQDSEAYRAG